MQPQPAHPYAHMHHPWTPSSSWQAARPSNTFHLRRHTAETMVVRLPQEKLTRLKCMLSRWSRLKCYRKRDLQSLVGYLHDASVVIRPFIRCLIDLLKSAHHRPQHAFLRLNVEARSDILWWSTFIESWNGLSMMHNLDKARPDIYVTSDTSGSWGCGAFRILPKKNLRLSGRVWFGRSLWPHKSFWLPQQSKSAVEGMGGRYAESLGLQWIIMVSVPMAIRNDEHAHYC